LKGADTNLTTSKEIGYFLDSLDTTFFINIFAQDSETFSLKWGTLDLKAILDPN
jgi:hypothetical protein